ncbi:hypothetical protein [Neisseria sp. S1]|uniref:hypothetical protein n=1 Tax=Neisseria sp. S1 TaxID=3318354 RepID=UPI003A8630C6
MDFEFGFKTLWGLAAGAFWFWVNGISGRLKESDKRHEQLKDELHKVKLDYATKAEASANQTNLAASLDRLEEKIDKLNDKLDRKADKT